MTQTTFKTEDVTLEQLKQFIADNPICGHYHERRAISDRFVGGWRSQEGLSLKQMREEVERVNEHYNMQARALVETINNISHQFHKNGDGFLTYNAEYIADYVIDQYGYDNYTNGTWVRSDY
jgi:hypothetical protein